MRASDDKRELYFRSGRIFRANSEWYFHTREGINFGPFDSKLSAEIRCKQYLLLRSLDIKYKGSVATLFR